MKKMFINIYSGLIFNADKRRKIRACLLNKDISQKQTDLQQKDLNHDFWILRNIYENRLTFQKYRNAFKGKEIVIVGAGPTLNDYIPIKNAIHIGTNKTYKVKKLKLDFLFYQDFKAFDKDLLKNKTKKFIGIFENYNLDMCPQSVFNQLYNADKFIMDNYSPDTDVIPVDISLNPVWNGGSVAFSAFQFALWTGAKKIYLVGCDSAGQSDPKHWHHFNDKQSKEHNIEPIVALVDGWTKLKNFAEKMYPDVEIVSINPVGLRGMFKDLKQKDKK